MRIRTLVALSLAALGVSAVPAEAAWKSYISRTIGFSFEAPGEMKTESGASRGVIAGPQETVIYRSMEDNIEYKITVINFKQAAAESATILGEAHFMFQEGKRVLMDTFARVEPGKDSIWGRKVTIDVPMNGGRTTAAFYFSKGYLIQMEATVLPANGDYQSPDPGRFIDSIAFVPSRAQQGSTELKIPEGVLF